MFRPGEDIRGIPGQLLEEVRYICALQQQILEFLSDDPAEPQFISFHPSSSPPTIRLTEGNV